MQEPRYRICYENGNPTTGKKIYELKKYCTCPECRYRQEIERTPSNSINITTEDIAKIDEIAEFLKKWTCENGKKQLETVYLEF